MPISDSFVGLKILSFHSGLAMQCFPGLLAASLVALSLATEGGIRGHKEVDSEPRKDSKVKFMDLEYFTRSEVDELLVKIATDDARISSLEEVLRPAFQALPKNSGLLTQHAVRYVLHRFFLQNHGWLMKGLEPEGARGRLCCGPAKNST